MSWVNIEETVLLIFYSSIILERINSFFLFPYTIVDTMRIHFFILSYGGVPLLAS